MQQNFTPRRVVAASAASVRTDNPASFWGAAFARLKHDGE